MDLFRMWQKYSQTNFEKVLFFDFHKGKYADCDGYDLGVIFLCTIGEDDLRKVINELNAISNVELLALNLGIHMSAWLKIEAEHQVEKQKTRVLYHWLKRMEITEANSVRSQHGLDLPKQ